MTTATDVLVDAFTRVHDDLPEIVDELEPEDLLWRPDADANPVAWIVWHLTRVQDDHLAGVVDGEQLWTSGGWAERFGLPYDLGSVGYGQSSDEVGAFGIDDLELLMGYHAAVHRRTVEILEGLTDEDYARIVDERWDPPVTCAVRLVSVVNDITQHLGQAAYVAGLARRR
ncbi:MAG: DinB family protein [Nocardioidaceae bacterium]